MATPPSGIVNAEGPSGNSTSTRPKSMGDASIKVIWRNNPSAYWWIIRRPAFGCADSIRTGMAKHWVRSVIGKDLREYRLPQPCRSRKTDSRLHVGPVLTRQGIIAPMEPPIRSTSCRKRRSRRLFYGLQPASSSSNHVVIAPILLNSVPDKGSYEIQTTQDMRVIESSSGGLRISSPFPQHSIPSPTAKADISPLENVMLKQEKTGIKSAGQPKGDAEQIHQFALSCIIINAACLPISSELLAADPKQPAKPHVPLIDPGPR